MSYRRQVTESLTGLTALLVDVHIFESNSPTPRYAWLAWIWREAAARIVGVNQLKNRSRFVRLLRRMVGNKVIGHPIHLDVFTAEVPDR